MGSRSFSSKQAQKAHLVRGTGGWQGEIADVRSDAEEGFQAVEFETSGVGTAQANIRLNTQPTATDTITIGTDVYEFVATLGSQTGTHIGVLRGAAAANSRANIVAAINGAAGLGTTYSAKGKMAVVASIYNSDFLHLDCAAAPGQAAEPGTKPNIALSDALTASVAWDHENLGRLGGNISVKKALHQLVVDAVNVAAAFDVKVPGTLISAAVVTCTNAAGVVDTVKAAAVALTLVAARNAVTVDLTGVGHPVATDLVYLQIVYI
jgi:hypothetical protein